VVILPQIVKVMLKKLPSKVAAANPDKKSKVKNSVSTLSEKTGFSNI
jgi:hypothetical protein